MVVLLLLPLIMSAAMLAGGSNPPPATGSYMAYEGGANGDTVSAGHGAVHASGLSNSNGPCDLYYSFDASYSIEYQIDPGCELWAYEEYNEDTQTCTGRNTFYSGSNSQADGGLRLIDHSKCFVVCCGQPTMGRDRGNVIQDGDIHFVPDYEIVYNEAGSDQNPLAKDCLGAINMMKQATSTTPDYTTGSPCANIAAYQSCHIAFCGGATGVDGAKSVTKAAGELVEVGTKMVLNKKYQRADGQGPDIDQDVVIRVDAEILRFDKAETIYHLFAWSK